MADDDGEKMPLPVEELLLQVFETGENDPVPEPAHEYPEALLQQSSKGIKLYNSFQSFHKQFVAENDPTSIIRWTNSSIQTAERAVVERWLSSDHEVNEVLKEAKQDDGGIRRTNSLAKGLNTLFSWSTGDSYVKAKRKEIAKRNVADVETEIKKETPIILESLATQLKIKVDRHSFTNKLNQIVELESNKFIHDRIKVIKDHHTMKITQMIHERKRKDHQLRLRRLQEKEEEYERALRAAVTEQSQVRNSGFFGAIFGYSGTSASHNHHQSTPSQTPVPSRSSSETVVSSTSSNSKNAKKRFSFLPWGTNRLEKNEMVFDLDKEQLGKKHKQEEDTFENFEESPPNVNKETEEEADEFEEFESSPLPEGNSSSSAAKATGESSKTVKPPKEPLKESVKPSKKSVKSVKASKEPAKAVKPTKSDVDEFTDLQGSPSPKPSTAKSLFENVNTPLPILAPKIRSPTAKSFLASHTPILSPTIRSPSETIPSQPTPQPVIFGFDELDHFKVNETANDDLNHRFLPIQTTNSDQIIDLGPTTYSTNDENLLNL